MGTRGIMGVVVDGETKVTYNHFDSYPEYLGIRVLADLAALLEEGDGERLVELGRRLELVDQQATPTPEQAAKFAEYTNDDVSTGDDWYSVLRNLQGEFKATLELGIMPDSSDFPEDSLFCEWGYVANLDAGHLEVYRGFQHQRPTEGLWAGLPTDEAIREEIAAIRKGGPGYPPNPVYADSKEAQLASGDYYYAIAPVARFSFADIKTGKVTKDDMVAVQAQIYGEED